jgi:2,5-dihydroxypyridine 5,6-dioxygenase
MEDRRPELMRAARLTMDACRVTAEESVLVFTDTGKGRAIVDAFFGEAVATGADATLVCARTRGVLQDPPSPAVEAMKGADIVFDLASVPWLYSRSTFDILDAGTRMLQVLASEDAILARPPTEEIRQRTDAAASRFLEGSSITIRSGDGLELEADYAGRKPLPQCGSVIAPGDWDSLTLGMCNVFPKEDGVNGRIRINGTLFLAPEHAFIASHPVTLTFRDGVLKKIDGQQEAQVLERWLAKWDDEKVYVSSHLGFGLDPRAGPPPIPEDIAGWESMYGGVILALGSNVGLPGGVGGTNDAKAHADLTTLGASFLIDGETIIEEGRVVAADLMARGKEG